MHEDAVMSEASRVLVDPVFLESPFGEQAVLFIEVHRDDVLLLALGEDWLRAILELDWRAYRHVAALYYQALWEFNAEAARLRALDRRALSDEEQATLALVEGWEDPDDDGAQVPETQEDATRRLMQERPTGGNADAPILHPTPRPPEATPTVREEQLAPGIVPTRLGGRAPKCFFSLLKAFVGVQAMGRNATAEEVEHHLHISPAFARACGFTLPEPGKRYRQSDVPKLRKLEQFEQIMGARGLWTAIRVQTVDDNIRRGVVKTEGQVLAQDTTHFIAYSAMDVIEVPEVQSPAPTAASPETNAAPAASPQKSDAPATAPRKKRRRQSRQAARGARRFAREACRRRWRERREARKAKRVGRCPKKEATVSTRKAGPAGGSPTSQQAATPDAKKAPKRKSQSRTIKNCRCPDPESCEHEWVLSDPGAGTVVKGGRVGGKRKYWAHKAAVLSTAPDGIPLDAVAMTDAASHDGTALVPQLRSVFATYPELKGKFDTVLADTAMDDADTRQTVRDEFGMDLKTPTNPRGIKTITANLGRGMKSLSPTGVLTCQADREMPFTGVRFGTEKFIYGSPRSSTGEIACLNCPLREACCRHDTRTGRVVEIPITHLPHIDPGDPPMARRFKAVMRHRTSVERAIKRFKLDFGDDHLARRGNDAFQAHLDRSLIALHLLLRLDR